MASFLSTAISALAPGPEPALDGKQKHSGRPGSPVQTLQGPFRERDRNSSRIDFFCSTRSF